MASEKIIVILLIIAIILSLVSTIVSLSNLGRQSTPEIKISTGNQNASAEGQVSIIINNPPGRK